MSPSRVPRLYLITDRHRVRDGGLVDHVAAAIRGGVDAVQLREKDLSAAALCELGRALARLCRRASVPLLVNDRVDVAVAIAADGVHLPESGFDPAAARKLLGGAAIIAASCHSAATARQKLAVGADFVLLGPIFETESKRAYGAPLGTAEITAAADLGTRIVAVGGLRPDNCAAVIAAGGYGVAAIGALMDAAEPQRVAQQFRDAMTRQARVTN